MERKKESYKANLKKMFVACLTLKPSTKESINELLEKVALSYGRTSEEAKEDVKKVLCLKYAVERLIEKSADRAIMYN